MRLSKKLSLLTSFLFCGGIIVVGLSSSRSVDPVRAESSGYEYVSDDENPVDPAQLSLNIVTASKTSEVESFSFTARSSVSTYANSAREKNIYVEITDESFSGTIEELEDGAELPVYEAAVYRICDTKASIGNVVVPRYLTWDGHCVFHVTAIDSGAFTDDFKNIKSILIHDDIETIYADAFLGAPESLIINVMHDEAPEGWAEDWYDLIEPPVINWGYEPTSSEVKALDERKSTGLKEWASPNSFIFGYHGEGAEYLPLVASYYVCRDDNNEFVEDRYQVLPLLSTSSIYDGVGKIRSTSLDFTLNAELEEGYHVDPTSILIHNIFISELQQLEDGSSRWNHNLADPLYMRPVVHYTHMFHIDEFFTTETKGIASFAGKTMVDMVFRKSTSLYPTLNPVVYKERENDIANGTYQVRTLLTNLTSSNYLVIYKTPSGQEAEMLVPLETPINNCSIGEGDYGIGFLFSNGLVGKDFAVENLVAVRLSDFYIRLDLYNPVEDMILVRSDVDMHFGSLSLYEAPAQAQTSYNNLNLAAILFALIYTAVFGVGSAALFFFNKNRFKNDEFRRVIPKKFWKQAAKNYLGFGIFALALFFIVGRWGFLNNGIAVFNPFDPFVIAFGIVGLIFIGYSIKNLVASIKSSRERRRIERLKINQDVAEDGTN